MIALLRLLMKFKDSPKVNLLTNLVRPVIAVLLAMMTISFFQNSYNGIGIFQTVFIGIISLLLLEKVKVHPAYVIAGSLVYGAIFLA